MAGGPGLAGFETRGFGLIQPSGVRCISAKSRVSKIAKPEVPGVYTILMLFTYSTYRETIALSRLVRDADWPRTWGRGGRQLPIEKSDRGARFQRRWCGVLATHKFHVQPSSRVHCKSLLINILSISHWGSISCAEIVCKLKNLKNRARGRGVGKITETCSWRWRLVSAQQRELAWTNYQLTRSGFAETIASSRRF